MEGHAVFLPPTLKQQLRGGADGIRAGAHARRRGAAVRGLRLPHPPPAAWPQVLNASHLDATGETYAVDADGRMVTESRFADQAEKLALLPAEAGGRTTAVLEVRDPGTLLAGDARAARRRRPGR